MKYTTGVLQGEPRLIELVGLAGVGKTTISNALSKENKEIIVDEDLSLRKPSHLLTLFKVAPSLIPILFRQQGLDQRYSWDEIKSIVYLLGWPSKIRNQLANTRSTILLDHGPVFKLTKLDAFGPEALNFEQNYSWWKSIILQWAEILDLVIWLDAPATVLYDRINNRNQKHAVKGKSKKEALDFLKEYQDSYQKILDELVSLDHTCLLKLDTGQSSVEEITRNILEIFHETPYTI